MSKAKVTITFEYEINLASYDVATAEEALAIDRSTFKHDPETLFSVLDSSRYDVTVEVA